MVRFDHPANRGVLAYLADPARLARSVSVAKDRAESLPADVKDPYMTLGTHPDLVSRLWTELGGSLPADCRVIVHGMPALVRPDTGVILGIAGGTLMYALRLDAAGATAARAAGAKTEHRYPAYPSLGIAEVVIDARAFGDTWIFGRWLPGEPEWLAAGFLASTDHAT
jgi:hypothetical protein